MPKSKILIVDDEAVVARDIEKMLEGTDEYAPLRARSGTEAVEKAGRTRPDIVLMDIVLKGEMSGIDAAQIIHDRFDIPVIYLTAYADEETLRRAQITEPFGYLLKPFEERELKSTIKVALYKHRVEGELKESEERFRDLFERAPLAYQSLDENGYCLDVNQAWLDMLGYDREEVIGRWFGDFIAPEQRDSYRKCFAAFMKSGLIYNKEFDMVKRDGSRISVLFNGRVACDEQRAMKRSHCIFQDMTEHKQLEEQLRHVQKMEAVGTLAGGIAHDFNNILAGIIGYATLLKKRFSLDGSYTADLDKIELLSWRGADLTRALLAFARKTDFNPAPVNLNQIAANMLKVVGRTAGKHILMKADLPVDVMNVIGDRGQLYQVVMNLYLNACEAMPRGGTLAVNSSNERPQERFFRANPDLKPGPYVCLSISDTGVGMDERTRERVFEPFFTTKKGKTGTGLGLSVVSGIVERHGGCIEVESRPGRGSTFKIYLPATEEAERPEAVAAGVRLEGDETVLVVDDNKDFREGLTRWLEGLGYTVFEAGSKADALRVINNRRGHIDIVILDMIMESASGPEVFRKMRVIAKDLPVIICTGYSLNGESRRLLKQGASDFIQKPFEYGELAAKIRRVLDGT